MKKLLLIILCLICINGSFAQVSKNTLLIGGSLAFDKYFEIDNTLFELTPNIGIFLLNRVVLGCEVKYSYKKDILKVHGIGIVPYLRYYIPIGKFYLYTICSYGIENYYSNDSFISSKRNLGRIGEGLSLFITDNICFEPSINYNIVYYQKNYYKYINFSFNIQIYLNKNNK